MRVILDVEYVEFIAQAHLFINSGYKWRGNACGTTLTSAEIDPAPEAHPADLAYLLNWEVLEVNPFDRWRSRPSLPPTK